MLTRTCRVCAAHPSVGKPDPFLFTTMPTLRESPSLVARHIRRRKPPVPLTETTPADPQLEVHDSAVHEDPHLHDHVALGLDPPSGASGSGQSAQPQRHVDGGVQLEADGGEFAGEDEFEVDELPPIYRQY